MTDFSRSLALSALVLCMPLGAHAGSAAPSAGASIQAAPGELTTVAGDHLTGAVLGLDCHGLAFRYMGRTIVVALDKLAAASSSGEVTVSPGNGGDRLTGRLAIKDGTVRVATRTLGEVTIPVEMIKCRQLAAGEMALITGGGPGASDEDQTKTSQPKADQGAAGNPPAQGQNTGANAPAQNQGGAAGNAPSPKEQAEETLRQHMEFLRNEAVLVKPMKIESDISLSYLHTSQAQGFGNDKVFMATATGRFGIVAGLEGFLSAPYVWGQRQILSLTSSSEELDGPGDVSFGVKYSALNEGTDRPNVIVGVQLSAPTGRAPYLPPTGGSTATGGDTRDPLNPQLGTGHWIMTGSVTALKTYDPVTLFTTVSYSHFIPANYYGVHVSPGDIWELNTGLGFSVNDTDTLSGQAILDYQEKWAFNGLQIPQTLATPISLRFAYTHAINPGNLIEPWIVIGATRDAKDAILGVDYIHKF